MPIGVIKEWVDHRILFAQPVFSSVVCWTNLLYLSKIIDNAQDEDFFFKCLWTPTLSFIDLHSVVNWQQLKEARGFNVFPQLGKQGTFSTWVRYHTYNKISVLCHMDFADFPFDHQVDKSSTPGFVKTKTQPGAYFLFSHSPVTFWKCQSMPTQARCSWMGIFLTTLPPSEICNTKSTLIKARWRWRSTWDSTFQPQGSLSISPGKQIVFFSKSMLSFKIFAGLWGHTWCKLTFLQVYLLVPAGSAFSSLLMLCQAAWPFWSLSCLWKSASSSGCLTWSQPPLESQRSLYGS